MCFISLCRAGASSSSSSATERRQEQALDDSNLEATHESLIPLEEDVGGEEGQGGHSDQDLIIGEAVSLAAELGRQHAQIRGEIAVGGS